MNAIFKILLWLSFVLLIGGCAVGSLQITKAQMLPHSFEDIPPKDISIAKVKQELREGWGIPGTWYPPWVDTFACK